MMPKTKTPAKPLYSAQPWRCRHHKDHSEIIAYVEASGTWEAVARVERTAGASAEKTATFIARAINAAQQSNDVLRDAMDALRLCLEGDHLTFSSEQAAERSVSNILKIIS